ncbi:hypothetical protein HHA02_14290 [Cobetia marina]|nr:hypothetical protein HHA02_14290 [Cobetia marina]
MGGNEMMHTHAGSEEIDLGEQRSQFNRTGHLAVSIEQVMAAQQGVASGEVSGRQA